MSLPMFSSISNDIANLTPNRVTSKIYAELCAFTKCGLLLCKMKERDLEGACSSGSGGVCDEPWRI